jgi:neutral amino acid transport system ATP-binding protein
VDAEQTPDVPGRPAADERRSGAHMAAAGPILSVRGVHRSFGGVVAVSVDEFDVDHGSIVALIGPNGAGKTTFFNVLTGFERSDGGSWRFEGRDLSGHHAYSIARAGMVRTFQTARVFPRLSVLDNVRLGATDQRGERLGSSLLRWRWRAQEQDLGRRAAEVVDWVGLGDKRDDLAGTLSGGQRKLLELARAVMASPRLLMLDEPMAGVNPALRQSLLDRIRDLASDGITVLFIEHDMDVVSTISDEVVCMAEGRVIARGTPGHVAADERVIEAYLGASSADLRDVGDHRAGGDDG